MKILENLLSSPSEAAERLKGRVRVQRAPQARATQEVANLFRIAYEEAKGLGDSDSYICTGSLT